VRNAVIFSVDVKPMQVGISLPHGNLNRVMEVGNAVVASQKQSPPNHRANAAQDDLELVNAQHLGAWYAAQSYRHRLPRRKRFPQFAPRTNTHFFMLSSPKRLEVERLPNVQTPIA
jgi:hypothetical protein